MFKIQGYESEIARLSDLLNQRQQEIEDWKRKYHNQNLQVEDLRKSASQLLDFESRVSLLSTEIERLNSIIKLRNEEIESLKTRINKQESIISELRRFEIGFQHQETKISMLSQDVERLNGVITKKNEENEQLRL